MNKQQITQPMLNRAMMEAVDFIHPEGWDCPPTLFALVPTQLLAQHAVDVDDDSPLTLVVQDDLPSNIEPGSEHLADYVSRVIWPDNVVGAVLAIRTLRIPQNQKVSSKPYCNCALPKKSLPTPAHSPKMISSCAVAQELLQELLLHCGMGSTRTAMTYSRVSIVSTKG